MTAFKRQQLSQNVEMHNHFLLILVIATVISCLNNQSIATVHVYILNFENTLYLNILTMKICQLMVLYYTQSGYTVQYGFKNCGFKGNIILSIFICLAIVTS